jgi:hypothetical protein
MEQTTCSKLFQTTNPHSKDSKFTSVALIFVRQTFSYSWCQLWSTISNSSAQERFAFGRDQRPQETLKTCVILQLKLQWMSFSAYSENLLYISEPIAHTGKSWKSWPERAHFSSLMAAPFWDSLHSPFSKQGRSMISPRKIDSSPQHAAREKRAYKKCEKNSTNSYYVTLIHIMYISLCYLY